MKYGQRNNSNQFQHNRKKNKNIEDSESNNWAVLLTFPSF